VIISGGLTDTGVVESMDDEVVPFAGVAEASMEGVVVLLLFPSTEELVGDDDNDEVEVFIEETSGLCVDELDEMSAVAVEFWMDKEAPDVAGGIVVSEELSE